jgi:hypothetical protein
MKARIAAALLASTLAAPAAASDFGVMESAEALAPHTFKLLGFPTLVDRGSDDDGGFTLGMGYGLMPGVDVEAQLAMFGDASYFGGDLEWTAWSARSQRFSVGGGLHGADFDTGGGAMGADATLIYTYKALPRLDVSAALDASFDDVDVSGPVPGGARFNEDGRYETYYFAPGVEFEITRNLNLLAEIGLGLNGDSDDYFSGGLSWYFR